MNAEIIAVGTELLLGQIANTNAQFLSEKLASIGINVYYHTVVGDNNKRLQKAIEVAEERADMLIFTGGLGPTKDDLTKETISSSLGGELV
ncbi:MAG: competence/damage-inducible protein A, partial [Bacillus cereus]|nr:competence/damage-inducible protein A [Bacillus cereus]